jgi:DNA-binding transcriptional LysR family regulator
LLKSGHIAFDNLRQGIKEIEFLADPGGGEVRIGCSESLAGTLLPPVIERLSRECPRMVFHIAQINSLSTLDFPELRERKLDVDLPRLAKPFAECEFDDDLEAEHLFDDELVIVAGPTSHWARRKKISLDQLADASWVLPPNTWNSLLVKEAFAAIGQEMPRTRIETFSVSVRTQLLATGRFVAAVPGSMLRSSKTPYPLKVLPIDLPVRPWPVAAVRLAHRTLTPAVDLFLKTARSIVKTMPVRQFSPKALLLR